jgi:UTP-glucose-1-phosphate uridylyltransferase
LKVIIPAAGLGQRFVAVGITSPKELLTLGGKPLIGHALAEAARAGFDSAIAVISPAKAALRQFLLGNRHPIPVEIVIQPQPLGIGDAVLRCWREEPVAVLLPDDVVREGDYWARLIELNKQTGAATLCVRPVPIEAARRFGIAECEGDRATRLIEKPLPGVTRSNLAIFGRYVVTEPVIKGLIECRGDGELQLTEGFDQALGSAAGVRVIRVTAEIYDCGTPADYAASRARFPSQA